MLVKPGIIFYSGQINVGSTPETFNGSLELVAECTFRQLDQTIRDGVVKDYAKQMPNRPITQSQVFISVISRI